MIAGERNPHCRDVFARKRIGRVGDEQACLFAIVSLLHEMKGQREEGADLAYLSDRTVTGYDTLHRGTKARVSSETSRVEDLSEGEDKP